MDGRAYAIDREFFAPGQATPESTINEAIDDYVRSLHGLYTKSVSADVDATDPRSSEYRSFLRAGVVKFTGAVAGSPTIATYLVPAANRAGQLLTKRFVFHNATSSDFRVKVPGSTGVLVRAGLIARLVNIGTDVIDADYPDIMSYTQTPGSPALDAANDMLLYYSRGSANLKRIAPANLPSSGLGSPTPETRFTYRGALVTKASNQNILATSTAVITFGLEDHDTDGFYGGGGSPSPDTTFFIPSGITRVRLWCGIFASGNHGGNNGQVCKIIKNGGADVDYIGGGYNTDYPASSPCWVQVATAWIPVAAGDRFHVFYSNGGTGTITISASDYTYFGIQAWPDA